MSHDLLDDLLADVPRHVTADPGAAWRAGTRRRRVRYAVEVGAVAAVIAIGTLVFAYIHPPNTTGGPAGKVVKVSGHPARVERPFFATALPDRPGPMAGALQTDDGHWHLVDENGRTWPVHTGTDDFLALSDDGTQVGHMVPITPTVGSYETVDLVTGRHTPYPDIGYGYTNQGVPETPQRYSTGPQEPGYWSPDGTSLVIPGADSSSRPARALLLRDGEVTSLSTKGYLVGWASPTTIAWLAYGGSLVRLTDVEGNLVRQVPLAADLSGAQLDQWSGRISPDGGRLAVLEIRDGQNARLWAYSLADGSVVDDFPHRLPTNQLENSCPLVWQGDQVGVFGLSFSRSWPRVLFSDRWGPRNCIAWAADAVAGPLQPGPGFTEWRYWRFWWHWRVALGALVLISLSGGLVARWWRRRPRATEPAVDWWG